MLTTRLGFVKGQDECGEDRLITGVVGMDAVIRDQSRIQKERREDLYHFRPVFGGKRAEPIVQPVIKERAWGTFERCVRETRSTVRITTGLQQRIVLRTDKNRALRTREEPQYLEREIHILLQLVQQRVDTGKAARYPHAAGSLR